MVNALSRCTGSLLWYWVHVYRVSDLPFLMLPTKTSPLACIRVVLTLTAVIMFCLSPLTLFAQEVDPARHLSQSPPVRVTEQGKSATNVIAVLKFTVTDNDSRVNRTTSTDLPQELSVQGNYPNPFRTATSIAFNLPEHAKVYAEVFDLLGRSVYTSQTRQMDAGWNRTLSLDLPQTSSGLYVYRINMETTSGTFSRTGRIVQIR